MEKTMNTRENDAVSDYCMFDDQNLEVRIRRYDTPTPWMNYLSNGTFHTMMSQAGGGLSFYKSPQIWRINRYRFFHLPTDRSGHYLYIHDLKAGEYWCPTSEPAAVRPEQWEAAHGLGYTRFCGERKGLTASAEYFVGPDENALIWNLKLENHSAECKELRIYAYVEFGMMEFMRELQWQCYNKHQLSVKWRQDTGALVYRYGVENQPRPEETPLVYMAADRQPDGFDGDRDEFTGSYRSESNPAAIEQGGCTGSELMGGDPCGALQFNLVLKPGESEVLNVFLGTEMTEAAVDAAIHRLREPGATEQAKQKLKAQWQKNLGNFKAGIPDAQASRMINVWNPYQAQRNFLFSRNISFYATGTFRGVGFRDTAQDIMCHATLDAGEAEDKIRLLLGQQYRDGHVNHYFFPAEGWDPVTSIHSDDHLWIILAVWEVCMETGRMAFLDEEVPWYDGGCATVIAHMEQAMAYTAAHLGENGFPLMLRSDWNDQLFRVCRAGRGESIWTAMQYGRALQIMAAFAEMRGQTRQSEAYQRQYKAQQARVNSTGWDGRWFRRAVMDNGQFLGSDSHDEAKIWLNTQTWAVISGMASHDKALQAMMSVRELLDTDLGIRKIHPPIRSFPDPADPLTNYQPGTGENGAVFCHANTWAVIAECMLGHGDQAYKYYRQLLPEVAADKAGVWRYKAEPYVYASNIFGPDSDKFGLANVSWLTGTAAWMYIAATRYILGIQPVMEGLKVDPCLPGGWTDLRIERTFRGCRYAIEIEKPMGVQRGVVSLWVDGNPSEGCVIRHVPGRTDAQVRVVMGNPDNRCESV